MFEFVVDWPTILGLVVSVLLPMLVGLVTKTVTSSRTKAILLAALAALTGLATELANAVSSGTPYNLAMGIIMAFVAFGTAVFMHFGFYKPTGISQALQEVGMSDEEKTPHDGV